MKILKLIISLIFLVLFMQLVSAYGWGWGYYDSPAELLENEWVSFAAVFILFFAIVFIALGKSFKEDKGAAVAIAVVVALFISVSITRRGWLFSYAGDELGEWALIVAVLIGAGFIVKIMNDVFGRWGAIAAVVALWASLFFIDIYTILPSGELGDFLLMIYEQAKGVLGIIAVIIIVALLYRFGERERTVGEMLFRKPWQN